MGKEPLHDRIFYFTACYFRSIQTVSISTQKYKDIFFGLNLVIIVMLKGTDKILTANKLCQYERTPVNLEVSDSVMTTRAVTGMCHSWTTPSGSVVYG